MFGLFKRDPTKKDQVNPFDLGKEKNWVQVFGDNPWLWFLPVGRTVGDGVHWETNETLSAQDA